MTTGPVSGRDPTAPDRGRRSQLLEAALRAIIRADAGGESSVKTVPDFALGAAAISDDRWWLLLDGSHVGSAGTGPVHGSVLGAALAWTSTHSSSGDRGIELIVTEGSPIDAELLARRARQFEPPIRVRRLAGGATSAVVEADHVSVEAPPSHLRWAATIEAAGAATVVEHGIVSGEVVGLEICRVVDDGTRLAVGIGAHDREAFEMLHGSSADGPMPVEQLGAALTEIVAEVGRHRQPGARPHPLNRLAAERLLRSRAIDDPAVVGASHLEPVEPPVPRINVSDAAPCLARRDDGTLVCFSVGVDLESVPFLLDALDRLGADGREMTGLLALRQRDIVAAQSRLAALARRTVEIIALPAEME